MRIFVALLAMTTPALAHPGPAVHAHETGGFWIAAIAFALGTALTLFAATRKPAKVRA